MRKLFTRTAKNLLAAVVVVVAAPASSVAQGEASGNGEDCPEPLRGSTLSTEEVRSGIVLIFETATRAQVDGLREHLRELATALEEESGAAQAGPTPVPTLEAKVSNTATGARLTLRTPLARDVPELRAVGRDLEEAWPSSPCAAGMSMPSSGRDAHR